MADVLAVVFDLFGTLTDPALEARRREAVEATAAALGVAPGLLWQRWSESFPDRISGHYGGTRDTLLRLVSECGGSVADEALEIALQAHRHGLAEVRAPREGALGVLAELRRRGFRIGLLSDCSSEVAEEWHLSPLSPLVDAPVFSWAEGARKPDPVLYEIVARRLGVAPSACWYVGDGSGDELSGALAAGMTPVLVTNGTTTASAGAEGQRDHYVPEHRVPDLAPLLDLVGLAG